jgi:hypothetical protein
VAWIPGIPFIIGDLTSLSAAITIGSVFWIIGIDMLLVGLGLWTRHRFVRLAAILLFSLAAFFQFIEFLFFGVLGSSLSVVELCVDVVLVYFLFSKFDAKFFRSPLVRFKEPSEKNFQ